ncbi:hypothetical protein [Psychromicrobium sp. YIM B11713]|uniref:hypothetical protein n=1 Tax=Psychromicrobium sp. YIM B11713 TaxID=3145233 RepID=UPI00374E92A5
MRKIAISVVVSVLAALGVVAASAPAAQAKADFSCVNYGASGKGWSYEVIRCNG